MQSRRFGTPLAPVLFTFLLSSSQAMADGPASGGTASYGPRAGQGNARVTVMARGKTVAITAFAWTASSGIATWKLVTIDDGQIVEPPQVFQTTAQKPLSAEEAAAIRERRVPLSKCDLYYCPPSAEEQKVWANQYKRNWLPGPGTIETPRDLVNGAKQRVTTLPLVAPFSVSQVALVPEPGRWVTKSEPRTVSYPVEVPNIVTITREIRRGTEDKYGNQNWGGWQYDSTRTENRGTRTEYQTQTVYDRKRVWEGHPENLWVKGANTAVPPTPAPPDPDRLITLRSKYDEATGLTTVVVELDASVSYARAYATIPGSDAAPEQIAGTSASASPGGTHTDSRVGAESDNQTQQSQTSSQRPRPQTRRRLFNR